jgi:hypothetical protein
MFKVNEMWPEVKLNLPFVGFSCMLGWWEQLGLDIELRGVSSCGVSRQPKNKIIYMDLMNM